MITDENSLIVKIRQELHNEPHVRHHIVHINWTASAVKLTGVVPSFYITQMAQEVLMHLLERVNVTRLIQNEILVE